MNFFFENLSLLPETSAAKEHFKLVFGSGTSDLAKIRPLKNWHSPDFLSGFALWDFASSTTSNIFDLAETDSNKDSGHGANHLLRNHTK